MFLSRPLVMSSESHSGTAAQGEAIAIDLATLPADGPIGTLAHDEGPVPW